MKFSRKTIKKYVKIPEQSGREISDKDNLEVIWEQVFPEDAEQRIQRAFEMLLNNNSDFPH